MGIKNLTKWKALLFGAFLFAFAHIDLGHVLLILPISIFLCWIYYNTKNLNGVIWIHFLNNSLACILQTQAREKYEEKIHENINVFQSCMTIVITGLIIATNLFWLKKNFSKNL